MACSEETIDLHPDRYDYYSVLRYTSENQTKLKVLQTVIDKAVVGTSLQHEFAGIRDAFYEDMQYWYIHEPIEKWKINDEGRFYLSYTLSGDFEREFHIVFTDYVPDSPLLDQSFVFAFPDDHEEYKQLSLREILHDDETEILNAMIYRCPAFKSQFFAEIQRPQSVVVVPDNKSYIIKNQLEQWFVEYNNIKSTVTMQMELLDRHVDALRVLLDKKNLSDCKGV